jgi:hypothetical protein
VNKEKSPIIEFHENGKTYFWNKMSKIVTNRAGEEVTRNCYNLQIARKKVGIK